jgi:glutathione S-transferase
MIIVHHLEQSRSQRILWLLEELELTYEIKHYKRNPATKLAPKELRAVHPLGKSPVITDGDEVIAESGAIAEYLVDTYGKGRLKPAMGTPEYQRYQYWLHYAEGSAMPPFVLGIIFSELPRQAPFIAKPLLKQISKMFNEAYLSREIKTHMDFWEKALEQRPYFVGDELTAADVLMSMPVEAGLTRVGDGSGYPKLKAFFERIQSRPAFGRARERGGV